MEYPNNIKAKIQDVELNIKPYLTQAEIEVIVQQALPVENYLIRKQVINLLLIAMCTDYKINEDEDYDLLAISGLVNVVRDSVTNLSEVDAYINDYESTVKVLDRALQKANATLEVVINKVPDSKQLNKIVTSFTKKLEKLTGSH